MFVTKGIVTEEALGELFDSAPNAFPITGAEVRAKCATHLNP